MKITKTNLGKTEIRLSKQDWKDIGIKSGWIKKAQSQNADAFSDGYEVAQIAVEESVKHNYVEVIKLMRVNPQELAKKSYIQKEAGKWGQEGDPLYEEFMRGLYQGLIIQLSEYDLSKFDDKWKQ